MKELWKQVTVDGKSYSIQKFDAFTGIKLIRLILAKLSPVIPMLTKEEADEQDYMALVFQILDCVSDEDLSNLVSKCLQVCYENLPAGQQPVMDSQGHYGVPDVEHDMVLVVKLCIEALKWGAADFFDGSFQGSEAMLQAISRLGAAK